MSLLSSIISKTAGRVSAKHRTLSQFSELYLQIIQTRGLSEKTLENRRNYIAHINATMGEMLIGSLKPHDIAMAIAGIAAKHPTTAKRTLTELNDMLNEALVAGWIDANVATNVRQPRIRIARRRLSLEVWQGMDKWAQENLPPWVHHMLVLALVTGQRRGDLQKMKFSDVWDGHLHVTQQKKAWGKEVGTRLAIPLGLYLPALKITLGEVIEACRGYAPMPFGEDTTMLRKSMGKPVSCSSMSIRFENAMEGAYGPYTGNGAQPSLHECRSLSCRLYADDEEVDVNVQHLLGHKNQSMTAVYENDRGLSDREGKYLTLVVSNPAAENRKGRAAA